MLGLSPVKRNMLNEGSAYGDFYNAIDNFFNDDFFGRPSLLAKGFRMDVKETGDSYIVEAELPGVKRDEIEIGYHNDTLYIATHYKEEKNMKQPRQQENKIEGEACEAEGTKLHEKAPEEISGEEPKEGCEVAPTQKAEAISNNNKVRYIHQERRRMSMQRGIYLPEIKKEAIEAKLDSGILTITVPKLKPSEANFKIQIQ